MEQTTVIDFDNGFEKRVYYGSLIAAMAGVAILVVNLSASGWQPEHVGGALAALFAVAVVGLHVLHRNLGEHYELDRARGALFRVRRFGPLRWEARETTTARMQRVHVRWNQDEYGRDIHVWMELEVEGGRRVPLSETLHFHMAPDGTGRATRAIIDAADLATRAQTFADLFGVPIADWKPLADHLAVHS